MKCFICFLFVWCYFKVIGCWLLYLDKWIKSVCYHETVIMLSVNANKVAFLGQIGRQIWPVALQKNIANWFIHSSSLWFIFSTWLFHWYLQCIENHKDATIANLDLILKWFTLRFTETNTSVHVKSIDYLQQLFTMLAADDYSLSDVEANAFCPSVVAKVNKIKWVWGFLSF